MKQDINKNLDIGIGNTFAIAAIIGFLFSVSYNYGYFWDFSVSISLLSIRDIIGSYSLWLPLILSIFFMVFYFEMLLVFIRKKLSYIINVKKPTEDVGNIQVKNVLHLIVPFLALSVIMFASWLLIGFPKFRIIMIVFFSLLFLVVSIDVVYGSSERSLNKLLLYMVMIIAALSFGMFSLGHFVSVLDSRQKERNAVVTLNGVGIKVIPVVVLRNLESGLLVKDLKDERMKLFLWHDIRRVDVYLKKENRFKGFIVEYLEKHNFGGK